ncbi:MAG TPA: type II secretion system protein N [Casimicrobiaceae bacterium]|nr:type II secretion system protein N [Casimicrobiaceae bacterium]
MRSALAIAAGAVLLAITLLIIAPAALLDARINALSDGRLRIANSAGTLWHGSGELVVLPAGTRQPLFWRLDAWPLLRGEIRATIAPDADGARSATVAYGRDRLDVRELDVSLPAQSVLLAAAPKTPVGFGGTFALHVERLVQLPDVLDAQVNGEWRDGSVRGSSADAPISLGDVRIALNGRGAEVNGPLRNAGGDVEIDGQFAVGAAGTARLDATVRPRSSDRDRADRIAFALAALGTPDGRGGYRVTWTGAWR